MQHELFLTIRQTIKICNAFHNNMSTDIKLSKDQILTFSQGSVTVLQIKANYQEARVKLTNTQLKKIKSAAKNRIGTIL